MFSKPVALAVVAALILGAFTAPAVSQVPIPEDCPDPVPVSEVHRGMSATGLTVVSGTEPEQFSVEVLGVLNDALGPGRDMIVGDVTSPAIEAAGGIWAGMSGSPVYVGDRLLGAVAYGLSEEDSTIAGITPAQDMLDIIGYPSRPLDDGSFARSQEVQLSDALQKRVEATGASEGDASLRALRVPLSVSGGRGSRLINRSIRREGLPYIAYSGSSASADVEATATGVLEPGDSFAGSFSYGDITVAEIGTAAIVCGGKAVAFGHSIYPFFPQGYTEMGANEAEVLTIVDNPNFKLATVEALVGTIDQDRLAGVRALLDTIPNAIPVRSTITAADLGRTLEGQTDVVVQKMLPTIANVHMVDSVDSAYDQVGAGSLEATWTIRGTRASGEPWQLTRSNMYASSDDIARDSFNELTGHLFALHYNGHEDVELESVEATATVREAMNRYLVGGALVSINGGPFRQRRRFDIEPRDRLIVRVLLRPSENGFDESADVPVDLQLGVPRDARGSGYIRIRGGGRGGGFRSCFYDGEYCARRIASRYPTFDDLLAGLQNKRGNNSVAVGLRIGRRRSRTVSTDHAIVDRVVSGSGYIEVELPDEDDGGGGEPLPSPPSHNRSARH